MPFKSDKQKKYLAINKPDVYNKYKKDTLREALAKPTRVKQRNSIRLGMGKPSLRITLRKRTKVEDKKG